MTLAQDLIDEYKTETGSRSQLDMLFEEIAEVLSPERIGFTSTLKVNRQSDKIYDTQPITSKRSLVNAVGGMLRPKSSAPGKWFDILPEDETLENAEGVKEWLEFAEDRFWRALYNPKAQFIQATGETDDDLITFGTGAIYTGIRKDQSGLKFKAFHLKDTFVLVDDDNNPQGAVIREHLTVNQAVMRWGKESLHATLLKIYVGTDTEAKAKPYLFIWTVKPRHDRDPRVKSNKHMPFGSYVVDVENAHLMIEEGFPENPFSFPRWDTRSGERYGRGPGVLALPDVLTLNQMGKTMLRALHRAVDPSWLLPSDSMVTAPHLDPGGVGYYDAAAIRKLGLTQPFQQMTSDAKVPWGLNAQSAVREQLMTVFFRNILNLPINGPEMTATEVIQRREEFVREIGSVFGRLESDYSGPMVERGFNIMMRRGAFGGPNEIPTAIQGSGIQFRFASPVEKAKRQIEESVVSEGIARVLEIGQVQPDAMRPYDWEAVGRFVGDSNDFPTKLMLSETQLAARAKKDEEAAAQEQQMQLAERTASMVPDAVMEDALT